MRRHGRVLESNVFWIHFWVLSVVWKETWRDRGVNRGSGFLKIFIIIIASYLGFYNVKGIVKFYWRVYLMVSRRSGITSYQNCRAQRWVCFASQPIGVEGKWFWSDFSNEGKSLTLNRHGKGMCLIDGPMTRRIGRNKRHNKSAAARLHNI